MITDDKLQTVKNVGTACNLAIALARCTHYCSRGFCSISRFIQAMRGKEPCQQELSSTIFQRQFDLR
jgi:hypothetical protein